MVVMQWLSTAKCGMEMMEQIQLMVEMRIQMSVLYNNVSTLRDFTY
jgi:hypothetical protein